MGMKVALGCWLPSLEDLHQLKFVDHTFTLQGGWQFVNVVSESHP